MRKIFQFLLRIFRVKKVDNKDSFTKIAMKELDLQGEYVMDFNRFSASLFLKKCL